MIRVIVLANSSISDGRRGKSLNVYCVSICDKHEAAR